MNAPPRILIIDDEEIVHKSCRKVFRQADYEIDTAWSGEEGLERFAAGRYDVVITDLKMPGIGGLEALRRMKERRPAQVVIVFTGYANVGTARDSLKLGAFDYIPKPFTPKELREVVENALRKAANDGEAKMLDLMAIVAHELKSPVATVHTTVETLCGGYFGELSPEQRARLETVMRNCQYLEDIIRSYIDLSKMELDALAFKRVPVDLVREVVGPVAGTPEYRANLKGMPLVEEYADVPPVAGDAALLRIVANNLVNNAVKYGAAGTPILVRIREEGGAILFTVRNEGPGIPPGDVATRLFRRFGRLKQKGTEGVKGSGLGLYICRQIVEKHDGKIEVDSAPGWVEFSVRLAPAAAAGGASREG